MSYLINKKNQKIAYKAVRGHSPGIIFIHGLNSDMEGLKALSIEKYAKKHKLSFIRFDCRGHGKSFGKFEDFTISDWKEDIINIIDNLTRGSQILIGSSMGGWLMALAAMSRPKKVTGLIGLATATDFGNDLYDNLYENNKNEIKRKGFTKYNSEGFSYILTKKFFIEAKKNNILKKKFNFKKPLILIHGMEDKVVNSDLPIKIMKIASTKNMQIIYLKSSDHRLSKPSDLLVINNAIDIVRSLI
jgi:pimeloyl-ACP methyl ester carboxylesterase